MNGNTSVVRMTNNRVEELLEKWSDCLICKSKVKGVTVVLFSGQSNASFPLCNECASVLADQIKEAVR